MIRDASAASTSDDAAYPYRIVITRTDRLDFPFSVTSVNGDRKYDEVLCNLLADVLDVVEEKIERNDLPMPEEVRRGAK